MRLTPALVDRVQNGLSWWYFQRHGGEFDGRRLETLDPTGVIEANIEAERILSLANELDDPGLG